ncbi:MAG: hypothetical protein AAB560_00345 [Patescibacteria group bacterium]
MDFQRAKEFREILENAPFWKKAAARVFGRKVFTGERTRKNWSGCLPFYLFRCPACGELSCDYPHGYLDCRNLICHRCDARIDFVPWWAPLAEIPAVINFYARFRRKKK